MIINIIKNIYLLFTTITILVVNTNIALNTKGIKNNAEVCLFVKAVLNIKSTLNPSNNKPINKAIKLNITIILPYAGSKEE